MRAETGWLRCGRSAARVMRPQQTSGGAEIPIKADVAIARHNVRHCKTQLDEAPTVRYLCLDANN